MFDRLEAPTLALEDFGIQVTVIPRNGFGAYPITALFSPVAEQGTLGQARGHLASHVFRCLPEAAETLAEGDLLRLSDGSEFAVINGGIQRVPHQLTTIHTVER